MVMLVAVNYYDQKSQIASHFDHNDLADGMLPFIKLLA